MALVKCPECGGEISSNAKQCVKCGCEITCCPECLTVYKGAVDRCTACGYEFKPQDTGEKFSTEEQTQKIEQQFNADKKTLKKVSIAAKVIEIVTGLIIALGLVLYFNWNAIDNPATKFEQMRSLFDGLKVIAIFGLTSFILSFSIEDFAIYFLEIRRNNWLQYQKFNYKSYIKEYNSFGVEGKTAQTNLSLMKRAAFIIENPNEKFYSCAIIILQVALYLIADICACVWFVSNLDNLYMVKFISVDADYTWKFGETSFIAAIIFVVLALFANIFALIPQDNRFKKWCTEFEK